MSDLDYAPPNFKVDGLGKAVFTDFTDARYRIRLDCARRSAEVRSTIRFTTRARGCPVFELRTEPHRIAARLDGEPIEVREALPPSPWPDYPLDATVAPFKVLARKVERGEHVLETVHQLGEVDSDLAPLRWGPGRVRCVFHMCDAYAKGYPRFLGSYLPANLEYDHFRIRIEVTLAGTTEPHLLMTSLGPIEARGNRLSVRFPDHFTTSFPWFDLAPESRITRLDGRYDSVDGRALPLTLYRITDAPQTWTLAEYRDRLVESLAAMEARYGPFPYDRYTLFAADEMAGGMEYAAATASDLDSVRHEVDHSYFARAVAPASGHAGWIDEAIASWADKGYPRCAEPPFPSVAGLMAASDHSRVTNEKAYPEGAIFLAWVDHLLAPKGGLTAFLRHYVETKRYQSIDAYEFKRLLERFHGARLDREFEDYVWGWWAAKVPKRVRGKGAAAPLARPSAPATATSPHVGANAGAIQDGL